MIGLTSMVSVPFDPSNLPKESVFFTYTGPDSHSFERQEHPWHTQAFEDIATFAKRVFPELTRPRSVVGTNYKFSESLLPFSGERGSRRRIDANGNTMLNRLLMSHFILDERAAGRIYQALVQQRMLSNRANKFGQTPLMLAVESGWPSMVEAVLRLKPDLAARDRDGHDAIDYLQFATLRGDDQLLASPWVLTTERIGELLSARVGEKDRARVRRCQVRVRAFAVENHWWPDDGDGIIP